MILGQRTGSHGASTSLTHTPCTGTGRRIAHNPHDRRATAAGCRRRSCRHQDKQLQHTDQRPHDGERGWEEGVTGGTPGMDTDGGRTIYVRKRRTQRLVHTYTQRAHCERKRHAEEGKQSEASNSIRTADEREIETLPSSRGVDAGGNHLTTDLDHTPSSKDSQSTPSGTGYRQLPSPRVAKRRAQQTTEGQRKKTNRKMKQNKHETAKFRSPTAG